MGHVGYSVVGARVPGVEVDGHALDPGAVALTQVELGHPGHPVGGGSEGRGQGQKWMSTVDSVE